MTVIYFILLTKFRANSFIAFFSLNHIFWTMFYSIILAIFWYEKSFISKVHEIYIGASQKFEEFGNECHHYTPSKALWFFCIFMWQFQKAQFFPNFDLPQGRGVKSRTPMAQGVHPPVPPSGHVCVKWNTYIWSYYMRRRDVPLWCNRSLIFW